MPFSKFVFAAKISTNRGKTIILREVFYPLGVSIAKIQLDIALALATCGKYFSSDRLQAGVEILSKSLAHPTTTAKGLVAS